MCLKSIEHAVKHGFAGLELLLELRGVGAPDLEPQIAELGMEQFEEKVAFLG